MSKTMKSFRSTVHQLQEILKKKSTKNRHAPAIQNKSDKPWLDLQFHDVNRKSIKMPHDLENDMNEPPNFNDEKVLDRIQGSIIGMAIGDALGAHVEFRPRQFLVENPVTDFQAGGTWGLKKGQFTDDTSMALCLANSLVSKGDLSLYDQLVRYKWWFTHGYMSSTGKCFDIGAATSQSLQEFEQRQMLFAQKYNISPEQIDYISGDKNLINEFDVYCSEDGVAGNGALMRLAPVPLFFYRFPPYAVEYSGQSAQITHGDIKAYDACRYYGALIVAALQGCRKDELLDKQFYAKHMDWFSGRPLCNEIQQIAEGSYQKPGGYDDGIRGKGYIVNALEAALWAFWSDENSFERGALAAVNLGDDADTTAAIYGQLAGAYYGYKKLPQRWVQYIYAKKFMLNLSNWIAYEGEMWRPSAILFPDIPPSPSQPYLNERSTKVVAHEPNLNRNYSQRGTTTPITYLSEYNETAGAKKNENPKKHLYNLSDTFRNHSMSPINKEKVKHHNTISYFTFESRSDEAINVTPVNKPKSNIYSSSVEETFYPANSNNYSEKTSHDNKLHKLVLSNPESNSSTDECISLTRAPSNKRRSETDLRNSAVVVERRSFDGNVESSGNMRFSSRPPPQNPVSINNFNANQHGNLITREENCLPQDPLSLPQSSRRNSKDASSTLITSEFRMDERSTNIQHVDRPKYDEFHSQDTIDEQPKNNQLSQELAALDLDQCLSWSCEDVCVWIKSCGEIYATYIDGFKRHNVDGHHLLYFVDNKALREFGVESSYNRRVIMHGIKNLKQRCKAPLLSNIPSLNDYDNEFDGDFVPPLYLSDTTYPNTMSCILQPLQNKIHSKVYNRILQWIGSLPDDIDVDKIEIIHNADLYRMFLQQIKRTERRQTQQEFKPNLNAETNPVERRKVLDYLQMLAQDVHHNRRVPIIRAWHGCRRTNLPKLLSDGFAALSKLDKGWYGTAMYFTSSAEYAAKYTDDEGCLIMCYVVLLNPFPVITDDAPPNVSSSSFRFYGRGNYSNYQCHYIPVAPVNKETHWNFRPPPNGVEDATYDELAVFQQADILPQVVVHLKSRTTSPNCISPDGTQERAFLSKD